MSRAFPQVEMEPVYGFFHYLSATVSDLCFRGDVTGVENLPAHGGYLLAANHASHLDPFILGSRLPRQVTFFARKTLWTPGFASWWLNAVGVIPVDRDGGSDVAAIKRVLNALKQEKIIIMFPEGTRSRTGELQPPKPGVGLFACRAQVPVVPARIFGSFDALGKGGKLPRLGTPVTVVFGRPMSPAAYDVPGAGKDRYQLASERIMAEIARLQMPPQPVL
ncbi:MAG TPA: lysophospholipid acyltransferase family protein [Opitutaceae bacterium]|nr:lysophospholipid acyltransferase family protein [Opitutaceae bacterium]